MNRMTNKPNGIYEQARAKTAHLTEGVQEAQHRVTQQVQEHPMSSVLTTFAIGMVAGTCLVAIGCALMHDSTSQRSSWSRYYPTSAGRLASGRWKDYVPDFMHS